MMIRPALPEDAESVWEMFSAVIRAGDSYVFDETTTREEALEYWMGSGGQCFVAEDEDGVTGVFVLRPNRPGRGAHIANASFIVHSCARGKGVGKLLGSHALAEAKQQGYTGMQFNFVVSSNSAAVELWKKLGFQIIGTVPGGFRHATLGLVDAYMMHKVL